jgi:hypothetical protein
MKKLKKRSIDDFPAPVVSFEKSFSHIKTMGGITGHPCVVIQGRRFPCVKKSTSPYWYF